MKMKIGVNKKIKKTPTGLINAINSSNGIININIIILYYYNIIMLL
jgi:hypothetical protein